MSYALSRPSSSQRSALFALVIGLHAGIFLLILAAKTVVPKIMEMPLVVDLLQAAPPEKPPQAKPLPMVKPQPVKAQQTPTPRTPTPQIEATQSNLPAPAAPVASPPVEVKAAPPTPPAEPLVQPRFDADYLKNPAPAYPPLSRRMSEEGKVILRVLVSAQGSAEIVEVRTSSGSQRLDEAALNTVRHWKFIPAKRGETAVQSAVLVPIIFKLEQ